jgi:hypothetical protein
MAVACVETSLPIWEAPPDLQETLLEAWWERRKKDQEAADQAAWERQIGRR